MRDLKSKGVRALVWDLLGNLGTHTSIFIVSIFLARLLEPSDFGLIAIVMVIVSIATIFSDVGLGGALIQRRRVRQIHYSSVFYFNITAGMLLTLLTFLTAPHIAEFYQNQLLIPIIQVMSFLFVISAFHTVQSVILRKELNYQLLTKVNLTASITSGIFGVGLAYFGAGVWSLVAQLISRELIINLIIWSKSSWVPNVAFSFKALKQLWVYGLHMFFAGLLDSIYERADYMIIGKLFPSATLGFFHQAKQLNMFVIKYSAGSLMSVLFPVLSKIQKDLQKFQNVVVKSSAIISFVTFLLLGTLYLVADELIVLLFGAKWEPSIFYFKILVLSGFAYPISALMVNVLSSRGKSKDFFKLEFYKKIVQSATLIILVAFGINAFLYSLVLSSLAGVSLNILFASREIDISFSSIVKPILIQLLISVVLVLSIQALANQVQLSEFFLMLLKAILFVVAYTLINWLFKTKTFEYVQEQTKSIIEIIKIKK